jgi:hypothetical protein
VNKWRGDGGSVATSNVAFPAALDAKLATAPSQIVFTADDGSKAFQPRPFRFNSELKFL